LNEDVIAFNPKADKTKKKLLPNYRKKKKTEEAPDPMEAILNLSKTLTNEKGMATDLLEKPKDLMQNLCWQS
jgi:hypothetical protein